MLGVSSSVLDPQVAATLIETTTFTTLPMTNSIQSEFQQTVL